MTSSTEKPMLIGKLANLAGVKTDTIRFYERQGLLPRPSRTVAGYRSYDAAALRQLRFIRNAQSLGFSLDEVRQILNLRGRGTETCRCVIQMAEATLAKTNATLREVRNFRDSLEKNLERWRKEHGRRGKPAAEFCALIESSSPMSKFRA